MLNVATEILEQTFLDIYRPTDIYISGLLSIVCIYVI